MSKMFRLLSYVLVLSVLPFSVDAQRRGIDGHPAPPWSVTNWDNLPKGVDNLDVDYFEGKVLYLYCFQSWCPGCLSHGFPTLKQVMSKFEGEDDAAFVAIQTVFEGFSANSFQRGKETLESFDLEIPMGQSGDNDRRSVVMTRYRTGGTPWTIIIDKKGIVRYNDFHISPDSAVTIMQNLLAEDIESK